MKLKDKKGKRWKSNSKLQSDKLRKQWRNKSIWDVDSMSNRQVIRMFRNRDFKKF